MPQVDLVSVCASGHNDGKVACETLADDDPPAAYQPADFPPESFLLSKDAEDDWIDRNAFIKRKNSGKSSSPHFADSNPHPNPNNPIPNSGSQRYSVSVKSKPSFICLPKTQKAAYAETKPRRPTSIRLFPKRLRSLSLNNSRGKSVVQVAEPSSPKVSCIGRVRSRRDRSRRKNRENQTAEPTIKRSKSSKSHKTGFWTNFRSIFRSRGHKSAKDDEPSRAPPSTVAESLKKSKTVRKRDFSGLSSASSSSPAAAADPPGLGAAKRFSSGRRSDAWAADVVVDGAK